jgi:hypothetical protein
MSMTGPRAVPELEIRERPPSTLKNIDARPLGGGAGARGPRAATINAKKHRRRAPWEVVPELEVQDPQSVL